MIILLMILIELSYFILVIIPTYGSHFYLYLMCVFLLMNLNCLDSTFSRIAEREENALLVKRKLLDNNTSHLYSYDTNVTTDHDDHLSNALEVSVVNLFDRATSLGRQRWRGYPHGTYLSLQAGFLSLKVFTVYPTHNQRY